jgi:NTP pyrophosphatase (non-canonical NTP hydrolase)
MPVPDRVCDADSYQVLAWRTMRKDLDKEDQILNCALGLAEVGELQNIIKKAIYHGHGFTEATKDKIKDECGDILWYLSCLVFIFDFDLSEVLAFNIRKLEKRYPELEFSIKRSIERVEGNQNG